MNKVLKLSIIIILLVSNVGLLAGWQSDNGDGTFKNPPLYADYPDPSIIRVGEYFYFASTTFVNVPGLTICRSQDLVNWEIIGHCIQELPHTNRFDMTGGVIQYAGGCFAPSIAYKDGTFHVVVTLNGMRSQIYHAKDPAGPWTVSQLGGSYFDPCIFIEDNGTPYLAWGSMSDNRIRMIQLNSSLTATTGSERTILSYNGLEGTHMTKHDGYYYIFNSMPSRLAMTVSRSRSLWGPYGETTQWISDSNGGGHQGGIVDLPDGSYWAYAMKDQGGIGRVTYIAPVTWQNNWPRFGRPGHLNNIESSYTKPIQNKPIMVPATSDEFNSTDMGLQWMWNHNPDNTKWSLTGSALRLRPSVAPNFWSARNSLTQKGQGRVSTGTIKIDRSNMTSTDVGGLGILGDPHGTIGVKGSQIIMTLENRTQATVSNVTADILYFRLEMNFGTNRAQFFWSTTHGNWKSLGPAITMGFDWRNGTFQGEQYAIFCYNPGSSSGYMDVDYFHFNDEPGPNAGTPTPTPTPVVTPEPQQDPIWKGGPYDLNGSTDFVNVPDGITSELYDFTVACFVDLNTRGTWTRVFDFGNDNNTFMMFTPESGTTGYPYFAITLSGNDGEQGINGVSAFPTGSKQHVAVVKSGTTGILYINGEEVGKNNNMTLKPADMGNTTNNFIGRSQWEQDPYLNANIDDFRIYNRPLSESEIKGLINPSPTPIEGLLGDVNGDDSIDIVDALLIAQEYVGLEPAVFIRENADVDCNGSIDIVDALLVAQRYVGLISKFC